MLIISRFIGSKRTRKSELGPFNVSVSLERSICTVAARGVSKIHAKVPADLIRI